MGQKLSKVQCGTVRGKIASYVNLKNAGMCKCLQLPKQNQIIQEEITMRYFVGVKIWQQAKDSFPLRWHRTACGELYYICVC